MSVQIEARCPNLMALLDQAPAAISEIDALLKEQPSGPVALRLNRIVALVYEISLCHDQIRKHIASQAGSDSSTHEAGKREAEALAARLAGAR